MAFPKRLVVTGATGKQGGALISALLDRPSQPFEIYAITRNADSKSAQALARQPNVHVVQGDFNDPSGIFGKVERPWGLFSVTNPIKGAKIEEEQGKAMTKAALAAGVQHIVFTATDRGTHTTTTPTPIPHFASKFHIEQDIQSKATLSNATWTFLRPVAFYENLSNDFLGKGFMAMWRLNSPDPKLQLVSTRDIGKVAAEAFLHATSDRYRNRCIGLAGDEISSEDAARIFQEVVGEEIPSTYPFVGRALKWSLREQLGIMFDWFATEGFKVDVAETKQRYPFMKDFRTWLEEESAWRKKK